MQALTARITGRRYHTGEITPLSQVVLEREITNPADPLAVKVIVDGQLLGYLEAGLARLVSPMIEADRPVLASPIKGKDREINLWVFDAYDRISSTGRIVEAVSSDGQRSYVVDRRHGLCTCPAGRFLLCRHQKALGVTDEQADLAVAAA